MRKLFLGLLCCVFSSIGYAQTTLLNLRDSTYKSLHLQGNGIVKTIFDAIEQKKVGAYNQQHQAISIETYQKNKRLDDDQNAYHFNIDFSLLGLEYESGVLTWLHIILPSFRSSTGEQKHIVGVRYSEIAPLLTQKNSFAFVFPYATSFGDYFYADMDEGTLFRSAKGILKAIEEKKIKNLASPSPHLDAARKHIITSQENNPFVYLYIEEKQDKEYWKPEKVLVLLENKNKIDTLALVQWEDFKGYSGEWEEKQKLSSYYDFFQRGMLIHIDTTKTNSTSQKKTSDVEFMNIFSQRVEFSLYQALPKNTVLMREGKEISKIVIEGIYKGKIQGYAWDYSKGIEPILIKVAKDEVMENIKRPMVVASEEDFPAVETQNNKKTKRKKAIFDKETYFPQDINTLYSVEKIVFDGEGKKKKYEQEFFKICLNAEKNPTGIEKVIVMVKAEDLHKLLKKDKRSRINGRKYTYSHFLQQGNYLKIPLYSNPIRIER